MNTIIKIGFMAWCLSGMNITFAQPFDTIISRFNSLGKIYPLDDSTFILVGHKDGVVIERVNRRAEALWTLKLGIQDDDNIASTIHCEPLDSSIQVYTARRDCDIYDGKDAIIYTVTFDGLLLDSLKVPYEYNPRYIELLSGNPTFPRLAYPRYSSTSDIDVILMFHDGDTMHIRPSFPGADSSVQYLTGQPRLITLSPDSLILVNTNSFHTFFFKQINGRYSLVDRSWATGWKSQDLFSLEKDYFITLYEDHLTLFHKDYEIKSIPLGPGNYIVSAEWQNPYLRLFVASIFGNDSVYVFDHQLNEVDKRALSEFKHNPLYMTYRNHTYYWTSQPYHYLEGAAIHSMNLLNMDSLTSYDIGIEDAFVPAYDHYTTEYTCISQIAYYHFPYIILTLTNRSDTTISHIDVLHSYECFCPAWHWIKPIDHMDLQPGETDTFWLRDIEIANINRIRYPLEFCLDIIHPDFHRDANPYPDNGICKTISLRESYPFTSEEIVRYFPNPAESSLTLYTEDTIAYNLDIFDTSGRPVYETREYPGGYADVDITNLPQGLYYLRFRFENGISTQGKFTKL